MEGLGKLQAVCFLGMGGGRPDPLGLRGGWGEEEGNGSERMPRDWEVWWFLARMLGRGGGRGRRKSVREGCETREHLFSRVIHLGGGKKKRK